MIVEPKRDILLVPLLRAGVLRAWAARDDFIRLAVVPLIVLLLIAAPQRETLQAARATLDPAGAAQADPAVVLQGLLLALIEGATIAVFAVNWIRHLTLGRKAAPGIGLAISARHIRFLVVMIGIVIGVMFPGFILAAIVLIVLPNSGSGVFAAAMIGMLLWIMLLARLSPAWIGIAIDARMPLRVAWSRTAGQGFKLLVALLAVQVVTTAAQELISEILGVVGFIEAAPYSFLLVAFVIGFAGLATQISILVAAFPHFLRETV